MSGKDFLLCIMCCQKRPFEFINSAKTMKWKYVVLQFLVVLCLLYMPLLVSIVRTQPAQLYKRLFSENLDDLCMLECQKESYAGGLFTGDKPVIYVFDNSVMYSDSRITLSAPKELIISEETQSHTPQEIFGMIAVYNGYIPRLLLPILSSICAVVCFLQGLFYVMSACALGLYRMSSTRFTFGTRIKISIMASTVPAMIGAVLGFLIPGVHIIVFQILCLLILFSVSKRYDIAEPKQEKP